MSLEVHPFNPEYHTVQNFREQIAVMYPAGIQGDHLKMIRSWIYVCQPGQAGFDPENPGEDTLRGWEAIDDLIENHNVRGICHTHPAGMVEFSPQDRRAQMGLAKANGKMYLWHVVHGVGTNIARVICQHMITGRVVTYDFGKIECDPDDSVVLVPLPPKLVWNEEDGVIIHLY